MIFHFSFKDVEFLFIPSLNITIHNKAVYKCSVDNNAVTVRWEINKSISTHTSIKELGIVTYGHGTHNSSLTIPGNPELNNTIVTCIASGLVDGMKYINSSSTTLFIQGIIIVNDLCYKSGMGQALTFSTYKSASSSKQFLKHLYTKCLSIF